jgi:hypothetical protein
MAIYTEAKLAPFKVKEDRKKNDSQIDSQMYLNAACHHHVVKNDVKSGAFLDCDKDKKRNKYRNIGTDERVLYLVEKLKECKENVHFLTITTDRSGSQAIVDSITKIHAVNAESMFVEHKVTDGDCYLPNNTYLLSWQQIWQTARPLDNYEDLKKTMSDNRSKLQFPLYLLSAQEKVNILDYWNKYELTVEPWKEEKGFRLKPRLGQAVLGYQIVHGYEGATVRFIKSKGHDNKKLPEPVPMPILLDTFVNNRKDPSQLTMLHDYLTNCGCQLRVNRINP